MTPRRRRARYSPGNWRPPRIVEVRRDSPCRGRLIAGDRLLELEGRPPLDILDYLEASEGRRISMRVLRNGVEEEVEINKDPGTPLGLVFEEAVFDGIRTCRNRCVFCFVDQMPPGLRPTLYVKDDDYRLSFYYGNFVTLNNLSREDMERIAGMRLSPLYVSLHSTDPDLRTYLMGGDGEVGLDNLRELLSEGIEIHLQVVSCPGVNDKDALRRTLEGVLDSYPAESLGVVPLGMTSHAGELPVALELHDRDSALEVLRTVEEFQRRALERCGRRLFYAADEFYLLAGRDFPQAGEYEGYPQLENGVGMARKFIDEAREAPDTLGRSIRPLRGVLTGVAGEPVIRQVLRDAGAGDTEVVVIDNRLLGETVSVTALLSGEDIVAGLRERSPQAHELLIPESMLREGLFIDDMRVEDVERETSYRLMPVAVNGTAFLNALYREGK